MSWHSLYKTNADVWNEQLKLEPTSKEHLRVIRQAELNLALRTDTYCLVIPTCIKAPSILGKQLLEIRSNFCLDKTHNYPNIIETPHSLNELIQLAKKYLHPHSYKVDICGGRIFQHSQQIDYSI